MIEDKPKNSLNFACSKVLQKGLLISQHKFIDLFYDASRVLHNFEVENVGHCRGSDESGFQSIRVNLLEYFRRGTVNHLIERRQSCVFEWENVVIILLI